MSEEKLVSAAAKAFSGGRLYLSVKCWPEDDPHPVHAEISSPIWSPRRREYQFTLSIKKKNHEAWKVFPNVGQAIIVADCGKNDCEYRMIIVGDDNGNIQDRSKILVRFVNIDVAATAGPGFLQVMFPSLMDTIIPKTLVKPKCTESPPGLQEDPTLTPMAQAPAESPPSVLDKPWYDKCGIGVGSPNCTAKATLPLPDIEDPEFTRLPTALELISQIAEYIGTVHPSPIVAEAVLQDIEKIKARLLSCMDNGGPAWVELNQVWIQAGVCYMITSITDHNIVLHALTPTGRADHGCIQGRTSHVGSIKKSFAYIGSVVDAVNMGFIK